MANYVCMWMKMYGKTTVHVGKRHKFQRDQTKISEAHLMRVHLCGLVLFQHQNCFENKQKMKSRRKQVNRSWNR